MKELLSFKECCEALSVDFKTFKKWLGNDGVQPLDSEYDERVKYLTAEQVKALALRHGRPWPPVEAEPEPITEATAKRLMEQAAIAVRQAEQARIALETLRAELGGISTTQAELQGGVAELRSQQETTANLVTEIQQATHEQGTQHQQAIETLQGGQQQTRTALGETDARQQEHHQLLEQHALLLSKLQERATSLETEMQSQAERYRELATRIDNQDHELAQLATTINDLTRQMQSQAEQAEHAQARLQEQTVQVEQRLQAQFRRDLAILRQKMQEEFDKRYLGTDFVQEFEQRAQRIETDEARDVAAMTAQQEQQGQNLERLTARVVSVVGVAEEAKNTAFGNQSRITGTERDLTNLQLQIQGEKTARVTLTERITHLETQAAHMQGTQVAALEKPASRRKVRRGTEAEPTT